MPGYIIARVLTTSPVMHGQSVKLLDTELFARLQREIKQRTDAVMCGAGPICGA